MTQCFRYGSSRAATIDISELSDDTLHGPGVIAGKVRILYPDSGAIVTANYFDDDFQQSLVDFEGDDKQACEYAESCAGELEKEIAAHLDSCDRTPHVIATWQDVEDEADRCWAV